MQRRPGVQGGSARVATAVRLLTGVLAAVLAAGTMEAAPVPRAPQRGRTSAHGLAVEPKAGARKAGAGRAGVGAAGSKARVGTPGRAGAARTETRAAKAAGSGHSGASRAQVKRRRGRKADKGDGPPVTMWRVKAAESAPKPAEREVAERKALTVEDFEKAASGVSEPPDAAEAAVPAVKTDAAKSDVAKSEVAKGEAVKPLTRSAVRAANERIAAERAANDRAAAEAAAREKIAAADRMAARPAGERLPMLTAGVPAGALKGTAAAKSSVVVRTPVAAAVSAKATVLPQVQANGPTAAVVARATALPRLDAGVDVSDPITQTPMGKVAGSEEVTEGTMDMAVPAAEIVRQAAPLQNSMTQDSMTRDAERADEGQATRGPGLRAATHEEMAEAAMQPVVLPGLYRDGRLLVPAPLRGTREILVHQNTMADAEGLERIRNESDLNRLRAMHELVDLRESVSLRLNPELSANRRCARVWSVRFAEDMSRAFYARFRQPLQVNSAARTVAFQVRLQRVNGNAAGTGGEAASPHLTGQALDFGKRGMSVEQLAWMRSYLLPLMQAGKVDVEEEFQQACFHISVYKSYLPNAPVRRRMEVAQLHVAGKGAGLKPME